MQKQESLKAKKTNKQKNQKQTNRKVTFTVEN